MNLLRRSRRASAPTNSISQQHQESQSTPRSSLNSSTIHPGIIRSISEETLLGSSTDLLNPDNYVSDQQLNRLYRTDSAESNFTHISAAETVVDLILGHSFSEFNSIRTLPAVSILFQKGLYIFPTEEALSLFKSQNRNVDINLRRQGLGTPLLQVISPMLSAFKRNSPILVFYKFDPSCNDFNEQQETPKFEYCKVFCKFLQDGSVKYVLDFTPNGKSVDGANFKVVLVTSMRCSFADCSFRNTRLRWVGTTQMASTFGSGFFKLLILNDDSPSLLDGFEEGGSNFESTSHNAANISRDMFSNLSTFPPVARFSDRSSTAFPKGRITKHGDIKLVEVANLNTNADGIGSVPELSLVMTCMSLVLRDQELRKNHGNPRCYDTSLSASVFY